MSKQTKDSLKTVPLFVISGLSGISATTFVQPFEFVKLQAQVAGQGVKGGKLPVFKTFTNIVKTKPLSLYTGLSAGYIRQATYGTGRLGLYFLVQQKWIEKRGGPGKVGFLDRLAMAITCGGISAIAFEVPCQIALNRMMNDATLEPHLRKNYKNGFDAIFRIISEEGIGTLWKGWYPSLWRAAALNGAQLSVYSQSKQILTKRYPSVFKGDSLATHFVCSVIGGIALTTACLPFDLVRTRMQVGAEGITNSVPRELFKVVKMEGPTALFKGYVPALVRYCPHGILVMIFFEQFTKFYKKFSKEH